MKYAENRFDKDHYKYFLCKIAGGVYVISVWYDADVIELRSEEYHMNLSGEYAVLLVVDPNNDYHWYRQDSDGTWSHKPGATKVITGVENLKEDAKKRGYTHDLGFYYISKK